MQSQTLILAHKHIEIRCSIDKVGRKTIESHRYMEYTMNGKLAFYFFVEVNSALKHIRKYIPSNRNVINYVDTRLLASI